MEVNSDLQTMKLEIGADGLEEIVSHFEKLSSIDVDTSIMLVQKASDLLKARKHLHRYIVAQFARRFADLASLVPDYEAYARITKVLAKSSEANSPELLSALSEQQIVALNLGLANGLGDPISDPSFQIACDLQIQASMLQSRIMKIVESSVRKFAPNLCSLIDPSIAGLLIAMAGGLKQLSLCPACNVKVFGAKKIGLLGRSSRSTGNNQGILYNCTIVQQTDPEFRESVFRDLSNKVTLAARVDLSGDSGDGRFGTVMREKLSQRLEKKINNSTPKYIRPLPVPGLERKESRGGRQKRALKKKYGLGEELTRRSQVAFGIGGQFGELGEQYGATALQGFRKKHASTDAAFQQKIEKKLKDADRAKGV